LVDGVKSVYHIWQNAGSSDIKNKFSFLVKLRPFCKEFLTMSMVDYDIHFYTAATRRYGEFCIEILKHELMRHDQSTGSEPLDATKLRQIEVSLSRNRLITRDDKERFSEGGHTSRSEAEMENLRRAERIVLNNSNGVVTGDI
jgi:hypothetical protein